MIDLPLHQRVMRECLCCHVEQEFVFKSRSDQIVCKSCLRHQGDTTTKAVQRDFDHVKLWQSELAIAREGHAEAIHRLREVIQDQEERIAESRTKVGDLEAAVREGFQNAPLPAVERWWKDEQVTAAYQQRDAAYRSRDWLFRALWAIDNLHHPEEKHRDQCSCGLRASSCKILIVLDPVTESLIRWEQAQVERLRKGHPESLPDNHPEVLKRGRVYRWHQRPSAG
jgi:hypothetical protein